MKEIKLRVSDEEYHELIRWKGAKSWNKRVLISARNENNPEFESRPRHFFHFYIDNSDVFLPSHLLINNKNRLNMSLIAI